MQDIFFRRYRLAPVEPVPCVEPANTALLSTLGLKTPGQLIRKAGTHSMNKSEPLGLSYYKKSMCLRHVSKTTRVN